MRRVLAGIGVVLIATGTPAASRQTLPHFMAANGYAAIALTKLATGHETVAVTLNGVSGVFILDSGAGATVLDRTALAKYALADADRLPAIAHGYGAGGAFAVDTFRVRALTLGGRAVPLDAIRVTDLAAVTTALRTAAHAEIDGVIGQDVLTRHGGVIDVAASTLYLRLPR